MGHYRGMVSAVHQAAVAIMFGYEARRRCRGNYVCRWGQQPQQPKCHKPVFSVRQQVQTAKGVATLWIGGMVSVALKKTFKVCPLLSVHVIVQP